jgi:DNA-binding transcriptional regulator YiaG
LRKRRDISQSINQQPMQAEKSFLINYPTLFGNAVTEIREEGREEERESTIMQLRQKMGLSAEQIATIKDFTVQYVQSVIDKFEKK